MSHMKKVLFLFFLVCFTVSCNRFSSESSGAILKIDPTKAEQLNRSQIMSLSSIIRPAPLRGEILKLVADEDYLLVKTHELSLYDRSGRLIRTIGSRGKGPGEYLSLADVVIQDNLIRILDRSQHKMLDYDLNGAFIKEYPIGFFGQSFGMLREMTAIYGGYERNEQGQRLFLLDENLVQKDASLDYDEKRHYLNLFDKTNFFAFGGGLRFLWAYDNRIFNLSHDQSGLWLQPQYLLDFGPHQIPEDFFERPYNNIMEFEMALDRTDYAGRIAGYYEDEQKLLFGFKFRGKYLLGIYSKESGLVRVGDSILDDLIIPGIVSEIADEWFSMHFQGRQAFLVMEAWQLNDRLNSLKDSMSAVQWQDYLIENPMLADIYSALDENDGPLIFVFDMKF